MLDDIAYLVSETITRNKFQQEVKTETLRQIYCKRDSIKRAEFFSGGNQGLKPEFMLTTAKIDYSGETEISYQNERYSIYRTYEKGDYIELYCEKKGGVQ